MKTFCLLCVALGIALLGASILWPRFDSGRSSWTDEKAAAYQELSAQLHGLSFRNLNEPENKQLYDKIEKEYRELDKQLQQARNRGDRVGFWLKIIGGVLAGVGGLGFLVARDPN